MHNSSGDTYSPCLGWQLSVYHLHPASPLLSFSFKCRWHSCRPFYLFICCFFLSSSQTLTVPPSYLQFVSLECLFLGHFFLPIWSLSASYWRHTRGHFGTFSIIILVFQSEILKCRILDCMGITCLCSAALSRQCFRGIDLPIRRHCFLVTSHMQHLHRECAVPKLWLPHFLFFSISSQ